MPVNLFVDFRVWVKAQAETSSWLGSIAQEVLHDKTWTGSSPESLIAWCKKRKGKPKLSEVETLNRFYLLCQQRIESGFRS